MVFIRKRKIKGNTYYYLEHTIKIDGKPQKKEKYLGKTFPKEIDKIKEQFFNEIYKERWLDKLDKIKKAFSKEYKKVPKVAKEKYIDNFMVKFTYNTNRIEGSTLTLRETANLLERGITPGKKQLKDVKETEAHKKVFYEVLNYKEELNLKEVMYWHKQLFQDSEPEIAGRIRNHQVAISGSKFEPPFPAELNLLLRDFFRWYNKEKKKLHPAELAALVHLKFVLIHPFTDGNGRICRLMMNFVLNRHGFPMLNIPYVNRDSYYTALERAQVKKKEHVFILYLIKRYLKEYVHYSR